MSLSVEYFFAPQSPWTYLGHDRFIAMARAAGARVSLLPIDLGGQVFPVSGGLPLGKRAPQRQAYRLVELQRFAKHLSMPLNLRPRFFPVPNDDAATLVVAVDMHDGTEAALDVAGRLLRAVWVEERDVSDPAVLASVVEAARLPAGRLEDARAPQAGDRYQANTRHAIDSGVFGAPSYRIDGELFWGQDRLDFVERRLAEG